MNKVVSESVAQLQSKDPGQVTWDDEKTYALLAILHHVLVMLDDWICDQGGFSRKAKGKYLDGRYS